jgi:uncharacterized protein (TIGR02147 family)
VVIDGARNPLMQIQNKVRMILLEEFAAAQAKNPRYSMRAFAKRIGVSQAAVSQILAGKRTLTEKTALKILSGLDKTPQEISEAFDSDQESSRKFTSLDVDTFHLISDWHHYAILNLAQTDDFESSARWIAKRLGIAEKTAADSIELLMRLDLLEKNPKTKKLSPTEEQFEAVSEVANAAMKKAARQDLELSLAALEETEFSERDFTAMTLCFDPARMKEAIRMIKNFRRHFSNVMESKNKKEVYRLNVQLFPLTERENK